MMWCNERTSAPLPSAWALEGPARNPAYSARYLGRGLPARAGSDVHPTQNLARYLAQGCY